MHLDALMANAKLNFRRITQYQGAVPINRDVALKYLYNSASVGRPAVVRQPALTLLKLMAKKPWSVVAGEHASPADTATHITLRIDGDGYHLRVDSRSVVWHITGPKGEHLYPTVPWANAPGQIHSTES